MTVNRRMTTAIRGTFAFLALLSVSALLPADDGLPPPGTVIVRRAVAVPGQSGAIVHEASGKAYPFSMQAGPYPFSAQAGPYPFGFNHGQYPFGMYHGRYPLGYYLGGYRYPFSNPYYSYETGYSNGGGYSYGGGNGPTHVGTFGLPYATSNSIFDYGDPGYNFPPPAPAFGYGGMGYGGMGYGGFGNGGMGFGGYGYGGFGGYGAPGIGSLSGNMPYGYSGAMAPTVTPTAAIPQKVAPPPNSRIYRGYGQ